jgi:FKBP-type peptidyl-prolyl cis-trans isomerase 2
LNDCDDEVIETSSLEQLRRMVIQLKRQEEIRQRLKRERSGSVTVVGDDEVVGDGNNSTAHEDIEVLGATDLRKERRKRRKNHKPTQEDEVIVID